jgi:hypothetical protein
MRRKKNIVTNRVVYHDVMNSFFGIGILPVSDHGQLDLSLVFLPFDVQGGILVSTKALHVGSTDWNRYCPLFPDFPPLTPQSAASAPTDPPLPILGRMLRTLRSASALKGSQVADRKGASGIQCRIP